ncbi:MAG: argininosuccinate synthase [Candidatus Bathyarchaeia archaeon]
MTAEESSKDIGRVVLAFSGGLDTSVAAVWLRERYGAEIITVTVNVGQNEDFKDVEAKAEKLGVVKHYTLDCRKEFVEEYVFRSIKANGLYQGEYPLSSALSRPLIASKCVHIALEEGADAIAHGCTGKGNDQLRFEITIKSLAPDLKILAPVRDWGFDRSWEVDYALKHGIPIKPKRERYSIDVNLWGRSVECGPLEDISSYPPEDAFEWTIPPWKAPDKPEDISIRFEDGVPIALNGEIMDGVKLISSLNGLAGLYGIGRIDHVEERTVGIKTREVYEAPAAMCVLKAHKDLEKLVLTGRELRFKEHVDAEWSNLVYTGLWMEPLREALDAFIDVIEERVCGEIALRMYKGSITILSRRSEYSLYDEELARYSGSSTFDQRWAEGFITIWGLPTILSHKFHPKKISGKCMYGGG